MHEVGLAQSIVDLVQEKAADGSFHRVTTVFLQLGALANVEPGALLFGFECARRGTVANDATLQIKRTPGTAVCAACGAEVKVQTRLDQCSACGSGQVLVMSGDEFRVTELEVS